MPAQQNHVRGGKLPHSILLQRRIRSLSLSLAHSLTHTQMMSDLVTDPDAKMDDIEGATNVGAVIKEAPKGSLS